MNRWFAKFPFEKPRKIFWQMHQIIQLLDVIMQTPDKSYKRNFDGNVKSRAIARLFSY